MSTGEELVAGYLGRLEHAAGGLPADRRAELLEGIAEHIASAQPQDEAAARTLLDRLGAPEDIVAAAREDLPPGPWGPDALVPVPRGTGLELAAVLMLTVGSLLPVVGWLTGVVLLWTSSLWRVREKVLGTLVVPLGPGGLLVGGAFLPGLPLLGGGEVCTSSGTLTTGTGGPAVMSGGPAAGPVPPPDPPAPAVPAPPPPDGPGPFLEGGSVSCTSTGLALPGWAQAALLAALVLAPLVVAVLLMRVARRRAQEQPVLVPAHGRPAQDSPWGVLEVAGVLVLALGGLVVPVLGALVGLALALASPRWPAGDKAVAALLVAFPLLLVVAGFLPGLTLPALAPGLGLVLLLSPVAGLLAAGYLALRLSRSTAG